MFAYQNEPTEALRLPGLELRRFGADTGTSKFDLLIAVVQRREGLHALAEFSTDLFDAGTIERMLGHLHVLLEGAVTDPDKHLDELPLLTESERRELLTSPAELGLPAPHLCVHERFELQVDRTPDALAVTCGAWSSSYRELDARANQVAHCLRKRGAGPDVLVGLCVERSLDMLVGMLGILKSGAAYLPLDPAYPEERIAFMVEDARAPVVLTSARSARILPEGAERVLLDEDWPTIAAEPSH
jgi:non-ribosomal peptide synthetase component F